MEVDDEARTSMIDKRAFEHPLWCDPRYCGKSRPTGYHLSEPHRIGGERGGDVVITAQLTSTHDEPVGQGPTSIELVVEEPVTQNTLRYHLDERIAPQLHAVIGRLLPMVR